MRLVAAWAVGGAALGFAAGYGAVAAIVPTIVRRAGHYGSHAGRRTR